MSVTAPSRRRRTTVRQCPPSEIVQKDTKPGGIVSGAGKLLFPHAALICIAPEGHVGAKPLFPLHFVSQIMIYK